MARSRARHWATRVGRRAGRARSAVEATVRQLGRRLGQGAAVRLRLPGTPRVGPTRFARNGPVALAYDVRGRGSPLVLIQGVGVGRWGWEPVADRLARRFQVITIDNRGIGASDTAPGHYSTRMMADDVLAVLDAAGIQRASVVGTSLGGMIAQELALAHPERVDKLVLVATIPGGLRSRPMPLPTTYLFAWAPFMTSQVFEVTRQVAGLAEVQLADARRVVTNARRGLARGRTQPTAWQPPGEATVRRVLARIDADSLDRTIGAWLADQQPPPANPSPQCPARGGDRSRSTARRSAAPATPIRRCTCWR
jgi:pimeloyl-ACP methyl ester carboxylesterase